MVVDILPHCALAALFMSLIACGCAETQRPAPPHDYPPPQTSTVKETKSLGTPWESEFGLVQAVKAGGVVFLSGQLGVDEKGVVVGKGGMETQMRQAYDNVKKMLEQFGLTMEDVLEETLYVTDMLPALTVGPKVRQDVYGVHPAVASTIVQVQRLALASALVEIHIVARASQSAPAYSSPRQTDGSSRHRGGRGGMGRGGNSPY